MAKAGLTCTSNGLNTAKAIWSNFQSLKNNLRKIFKGNKLLLNQLSQRRSCTIKQYCALNLLPCAESTSTKPPACSNSITQSMTQPACRPSSAALKMASISLFSCQLTTKVSLRPSRFTALTVWLLRMALPKVTKYCYRLKPDCNCSHLSRTCLL